ncbi:MAG: hypothetical protein M3198_03505 [Actinomycetota bacterium]|nr:hypothetical protein [Actinomycetota bacterium]
MRVRQASLAHHVARIIGANPFVKLMHRLLGLLASGKVGSDPLFREISLLEHCRGCTIEQKGGNGEAGQKENETLLKEVDPLPAERRYPPALIN